MNTKRPFAFVIMPFGPEWKDTYDCGILPACNAAGARCERVDEQIFLESILERIYPEIERADLVIAEMTGRNPNVLYEIGYAHGLGKPVILLTRSADDIPFDLRLHPHVVYSGSLSVLKERLEKRVRYLVDRPPNVKSGYGRPSAVSQAIALATHALSRINLNGWW